MKKSKSGYAANCPRCGARLAPGFHSVAGRGPVAILEAHGLEVAEIDDIIAHLAQRGPDLGGNCGLAAEIRE